MKKITTILILILNTIALNAQSFTVFDIDTTSFPIMKAKFYAFDENYKQLLDLSPDDFEIYEDGVEREVLSISCPEPKPPTALSSVLVMDVSGSMMGKMLEKAQEAARSWVNGLPLGKSECAITSFDNKNNMIQDFTKDRNRLLEKIELLGAGGGTDYEAGFINPLAGGLLVAQTGKYKKVLVFLTDGRPNFTPDVSEIVAEANKYDITIFAVTLDMPCPQCLEDITVQTGGSCFENVSTVEGAREIYMRILQSSQGGGACEIEWESGYSCRSVNAELQIEISVIGLNFFETILYPSEYLAMLQFNPGSVYFKNKKPGLKHDTMITVKASNADFHITEIKSSNTDYEMTPSNFFLEDGDSITLTISFTPTDSSYCFSQFELINNICETNYYSSGVFLGIKSEIKTLKLTHPNGGEVFVVGGDTVITWEGIAANENVVLEYSIDNGNNWKEVCDTSSGLTYTWENIPEPVSNDCLVRVKQIQNGGGKDSIPEIEWQKCLGGSDHETIVISRQTFEGGYIVGGYTASNDGDVSALQEGLKIWIVKLNPAGILEWQIILSGSNHNVINSIEQTIDGGFIIGGHTKSNDGDFTGNHGCYDVWVQKLNISGKTEWQTCYGGSGNDLLRFIKQTSEGGYIVGANTTSKDGDVSGHHKEEDIWIVKLNSIGKTEWQKCFGGSAEDNLFSILQTNDEGFIVSAYTYSNDGDIIGQHGDVDVWIFKLNSSGNIEWQKCFGGSNTDNAPSITLTHTINNEYIFAFNSQSSDAVLKGHHGYSDIWIVKLNSQGEINWQKFIGGSGYDVVYGVKAIKQTFDGGCIIQGQTCSNDGDVSGNQGERDLWIVKLNFIGEIEWQKCLGGSGNETMYSIQQTDDGGFVVLGYIDANDGNIKGLHGNNDIWVVKLNSVGIIEWQKCLGGTTIDKPNQIFINNGYMIVGESESTNGDVYGQHGKRDFWIVKLFPDAIFLQEDVSDSVFAIVAPEITAIDIDMGKVLVGKTKDSVVTDFITNIGTWECRIDSIYFRGVDSAAFSLVSGIPQYTIASGANHYAEFGFRPSKAGLHEAEIVIISQADTLIQKITGEGIEPKLAVMCDWIDFGQVYLTEHKDTVKAIIENTGTASIEITKTEITGPDLDQFEIIDGGGGFTLNAGEERELTLRFKPEYLGKTSTNLKFYHNESGSPALTQLYGEGIKKEADCDSTGFEYPDFSGVDDILLPGSAGRVDDFIRLTYANTNQAGGIWHEKPVPVGNGFITEFSFRMSSGDNVNTDDGSLPGADGLAFVIQNNESIEMGLYGGGISYHGINNAIAVEFDLFKNDRTQIINFKDPNGNHVAIQKIYGDKLSAMHNSDNTIEINQDIPELKSDGTIYYAKIEYNIEPNVMSVYLDESGELDDPVIVAGGIELTDIVNLKEDLRAFVGITSATGNAYQIHDLLDWYFCPFPVDITAVESNMPADDITLNIYPNPVSESTTIEFNNPECQYISLVITDIFGREVKSLCSGYRTPGNITFNWNTSGITDGVYFCRLNFGKENMVKALVVSK